MSVEVSIFLAYLGPFIPVTTDLFATADVEDGLFFTEMFSAFHGVCNYNIFIYQSQKIDPQFLKHQSTSLQLRYLDTKFQIRTKQHINLISFHHLSDKQF